jgi:hypothetical protein
MAGEQILAEKGIKGVLDSAEERVSSRGFKKICLWVQKIFLTSDWKSSTKALVLSKRLPGLSSFGVKSKGSRASISRFHVGLRLHA